MQRMWRALDESGIEEKVKLHMNTYKHRLKYMIYSPDYILGAKEKIKKKGAKA